MMFYLLTVCAGISAWWLLYRIFLKSKAAAKTNRFFLLGGLILPFILPLIRLSTGTILAAKPILLPVITFSETSLLPHTAASSTNWLLLIYVVGTLLMLFYNASGLFTFIKLKQQSSAEKHDKNIYRIAGGGMPFSFFGSIFLPEQLPTTEEALIVAHEKWHIKLHHSWDVAFGTLVQSALWFFPLVNVYVRDLRLEHEFEVDELMLQNTSFPLYAETLLHVSLMPIRHAKFNSFSAPTLKNRIKMMTKTQKRNSWKLLLFVPLIGSMTYLNACSQQVEETVEPPTEIDAEQPATLQMADVDAPPQFLDCATTEGAEAQMQCFNAGIVKQIMENMKYPESARTAGIEGTIYIAFVIGTDGNITNKIVKRSIDKTPENEAAVLEMEAAALQVFNNLPELTPAQKDGNAVAIEYVVPIKFALEAK